MIGCCCQRCAILSSFRKKKNRSIERKDIDRNMDRKAIKLDVSGKYKKVHFFGTYFQTWICQFNSSIQHAEKVQHIGCRSIVFSTISYWLKSHRQKKIKFNIEPFNIRSEKLWCCGVKITSNQCMTFYHRRVTVKFVFSSDCCTV